MIGAALEASDTTVEQSDIKSENNEGDLNHQEGTTEMTTHNVFEQNGVNKHDRATLTHSQLQPLLKMRNGWVL